jgi:transposase
LKECFAEGANISEVARRNGVARGLLTLWRHQVAAVGGKAPSFVPIQIGAESGGGTADGSERMSSAQTRSLEISAPLAKASGVVEIEVNGAIRVEPGVELATLSTVLAALRGIR